MRIITATFFPGPNRHVLRPALEAFLELGEYSDLSSTEQPHFIEALLRAFPGLGEHHCSRAHVGGFCERLREGTFLGHVVEHVALEYLYRGGESGVYGKTRQVVGDRVMVAFEAETESGGIAALRAAIMAVTALWRGGSTTPDFPDLREFRQELSRYRLGPSTRAIVDAARRRDIPVTRLDGESLVRLGQGVRQRRIRAALTDQTSIIGTEVAQDKQWTGVMLHNAGLPVPFRFRVNCLEDAQRAFQDMDGPVVLKPVNGNHGSGVVMNIQSPRDLVTAFEAVRAVSDEALLLEQQITGMALRILVVGNEVVAATERRVPRVVGDGRRTIEELAAELNEDPRRGADHGFCMSWVPHDAESSQTLAEQGWSWGSVAPRGAMVILRRTANMSTGASAYDVTSQISPQLGRDAIRAASAVGLDIAGVDLVTRRLDCSLRDGGGAIIEVNAAPGLRMHLYPEEGKSQPVADCLIDYLFTNEDGRIPVAAITGTNGKTTVTRMLGHIGGRAGYRVGMATTDGITIGGDVIKAGDLTGPWSARLVLNDPSVEWAVLETARGGMVRAGLGFDDVDVGVVTNIGQDHLGQDGIETLEDLIHLKALVVDVVRPTGKAVLNADDPHVLKLRERCRGEVVLFSTAAHCEALQRHITEGGQAVYVKRGYLYYGCAGTEKRLIGIRALPASLGGVAAINVANAAAAAAAALAMGISPRVAADGLRTFPAGGAGLNRGRLEMLTGTDVRVLVDYGHNIPAITALGEICRRLRPRHIVTVIGLPGDRRNDDIQQSARVVAGFSHKIVIREDLDLRGRSSGEVAHLIQEAVEGEGQRSVRVIVDEAQAVKEAVLGAEPGSLILILYERYSVVRQAAEEALLSRDALRPQPEDVLAQA